MLNALGTLTEGGLVQITQGGVHDGVVVSMLDTVREYAAERSPRVVRAWRYVIGTRPTTPRWPSARRSCCGDRANWTRWRAWSWSTPTCAPQCCGGSSAGSVHRFYAWHRRCAASGASAATWPTAGRSLHRRLPFLVNAPTAVCLEAVLSAERLAYLQRDFVSASRLLDQALELGRTLGDAHGTAIILNSCGVVAMRRGELAHARAYHEQNLAVCETLGDARLLAMTQYNLGTLSAREGDLAEADRFLHASLECARGIGDDLLTATNLTALG